MKVIELDECYSIEIVRDNVTLRYKCISGEINKKTGKPIVSSDYWYYSNIQLALKKFLSESAADNTDVKQILKRIDDVEKLVESKF